MIKLNNKLGFTLNEIMIALFILAMAFIPTIGVISSAMRATEKDDHIIKGMSLCQEKLNAVLQLPFDYLDCNTYTGEIIATNTGYSIYFGNEEQFGKIKYFSELEVASRSVDFYVPMFDFSQLALCRKNKTLAEKKDEWDKGIKKVTVDNMIKRYTVTVKWNEKEGGENKERFYKLSALKANIR